jgi:hypothetical protein
MGTAGAEPITPALDRTMHRWVSDMTNEPWKTEMMVKRELGSRLLA